MAKFFLPDEGDQRILKELVRQIRTGRINPQAQNVPPTDDPQSPEIYIALPPLAGIPALSKLGTGEAFGEGDTPGSADCDIYKIKSDGTIERVGSATQKVYNLSGLLIETDWIIIERTKFGFWIATPVTSLLIKEGTLQGNLAEASSANDGPTTASLEVYGQPAAGTGGLVATGEFVTVTNRFTEITLIPAGTWVVVTRINDEWRPIAADCKASIIV